VSVISENGYSGSVALSCNAGAQFSGCSLSPPGAVAVGAGGSGAANLTVTAPLNMPAGQHSVLVRSNDAGFPALTHEVAAPVVVYDYQLSPGASGGSRTVSAGGSASYDLNLSSGPHGFPQKVALACAGLPQLSSCEFSASEIPAGSNQASVQLTIRTTAVTVAGSPARPRIPVGMLWLTVVAGVAGVRRSASRRRRRLGLGALTLLAAVALSNCGGGGGNDFSPPIPRPGTPSGLYTVTILGSSTGSVGALDRNTQVTLIVQ
jgi:hypothetical protein